MMFKPSFDTITIESKSLQTWNAIEKKPMVWYHTYYALEIYLWPVVSWTELWGNFKIMRKEKAGVSWGTHHPYSAILSRLRIGMQITIDFEIVSEQLMMSACSTSVKFCWPLLQSDTFISGIRFSFAPSSIHPHSHDAQNAQAATWICAFCLAWPQWPPSTVQPDHEMLHNRNETHSHTTARQSLPKVGTTANLHTLHCLGENVNCHTVRLHLFVNVWRAHLPHNSASWLLWHWLQNVKSTISLIFACFIGTETKLATKVCKKIKCGFRRINSKKSK